LLLWKLLDVSPSVVLSPREPELFLLLKCDVLVLAQLIEFFDRQSDTADTSVYEFLGDSAHTNVLLLVGLAFVGI
jgi:hypothetical protein